MQQNKYPHIIIFIAAALILVAGAVLLYKNFNPENSIYFPKCIFHTLTGLDCPGCGTQRAIHSLLNGDIAAAFKYNLLTILALPYIGVWFVLKLTESVSVNKKIVYFAHNAIKTLYHGKAIYVILIIVLLFWIIRNFTEHI